jgi:hypothetical protein
MSSVPESALHVAAVCCPCGPVIRLRRRERVEAVKIGGRPVEQVLEFGDLAGGQAGGGEDPVRNRR